MEHPKWEEPIRGAIAGTVFCLAYLAAWFNSLDQWFLPAGVRVAALLFLPYRYWPYILAGDITSMLLVRIPHPSANTTWVYAGSVLTPPLYCLAIAIVREKFKSLSEQAKWLPLIAACMAIWGATTTLAINSIFDGPSNAITFEFFYRRCIGQFLGIITVTLATTLWLTRHAVTHKPSNFLRDLTSSGAFLALIFCSLVIPEKIEDHLRIGIMTTTMIPVIFMTFRHGWRGAAIATALSTFTLAKTLYAFDYEGAHDTPVFIAHYTLAIASCGLLVIGRAISSQYAIAKSLGISEKQALQASRASFLLTEPMLRGKALTMEQMQLHIDSERKRVADYLKSIGDFEGALLLNNESMEHNSRFGAYATDLYPLRLERQGLNAVLNSKEFSDARGGGAHVLPLLGANPTHLSLELQLVAYRCAGNAIDVLSELRPRAYVIKTRVRKAEHRRGIALIVTVRDPGRTQGTPKSANAAIELAARVKAHGGIVKRRHAHRVSLWISEPIEQPAADQSVDPGWLTS